MTEQRDPTIHTHRHGDSPRLRCVSRREFLVLAAAGLLAGCSQRRLSPPPIGAPAAATALALTNGTLVDGTGAAPIVDAALVIQGTRIAAAGPRADVVIPPDVRTIDVQGATILPGFINTHVHNAYDETILTAWARGGVTTVRDLASGKPRESLFSFRDEVLSQPECARLVAVGPMVTVPDGYPIAMWSLSSLTVTSPEDARDKVVHLLDDGADLIKIALESGAIFGQSMPMLSPEEAAAIVQIAHERGTVVSAHVSISRDLERALDAGVDDIAHMVTDRVPDELIQRMVESDVYWVPTLELWKGVGHGLDTQVVDNLRRFAEAGGKVALGTDYAGAPDVDFDLGMPIDEIGWMQEAGMTPLEIIVAATRNGAHVCNLERELGTLEVGKLADALVVNGDPLENLGTLTNVRMVLHSGVMIRE